MHGASDTSRSSPHTDLQLALLTLCSNKFPTRLKKSSTNLFRMTQATHGQGLPPQMFTTGLGSLILYLRDLLSHKQFLWCTFMWHAMAACKLCLNMRGGLSHAGLRLRTTASCTAAHSAGLCPLVRSTMQCSKVVPRTHHSH